MRDLIKNYDDFMDFLGEAFEAICAVGADAEIADQIRDHAPVMSIASAICRRHRDDVAVIAAAARGVSVEEFRASYNTLALLSELNRLLKNPTVIEVFRSAAAMPDETQSASS